MQTTARFIGILLGGMPQRIGLALLCLAALSAASSGCGVGSEALPSSLPPVGGGIFFISTTQIEDGVFNRSYSKQLDTTGGTPPLTSCTFSGGTPPPGLNVVPIPNTGSCRLSGFPSMAGSFTFTVQAQDSASNTDTQDYTMAIRDEFTITGPAPDPLPDGVEDAAYNFVFTVTTDTVQGPDDFNEAAENGNGPLTACTLTGLPAGMMAVGGTFTANTCQVTVSGTPNLGIQPVPLGGMPQTFLLTLSVTDSPIPGSNTPAGTVMQTNIDLTIRPPVAISLVTADPMMTTCAGGSFDDSTGGGAAPDGVTGRTYGDPQCDLLFMATGGIATNYTWTDNSASPPTPFGCTQETITNPNDGFRCNSGMAALMTAGGTATDVTVEVMDSGPGGNMGSAASTQGTDIFGHVSHSIFINDEIAINNVFLTNGVAGQSYTQTLTCDAGSGFCGGTGSPNNAAAMYTWSEVGGPANANILVDGTPVGQPGDGTYFGTPTTADTGTFMPVITVTDDGNATTPSCAAAATCDTFTPTYNVFSAVAAIDASNNEVDIFDTNTNTFNAASFGLGDNVTLDMGSTPFRAAFTPNGSFLVVADMGEGEVHIINVATGAITTASVGGDPSYVVIGPATNPLSNPDSWFAYVANPTGGFVSIIDLDPNSGTFGTAVGSVVMPAPNDLAITPTFAGPETRVYVLSGTDDVCAFDADPGSIGTPIDIDPGAGTCLDTSAIAGDTRFIEVTRNGLQAIITKSDGLGAPAGMAFLVRVDTAPGSGTRDTITHTFDLGFTNPGSLGMVTGTNSCLIANDLRSDFSSTFVLVACGNDPANVVFPGDVFVQFDTTALGFLPPIFPVTAGDNPQDVAFTIGGGEAIGSLKGVSSIRRIGAGVTTALPNVTAPDGVDHIRDPQMNTLVNATFPIQAPPQGTARAGKEFTTSVAVSGGVQPYTWSVVDTLGTACEGLNLDPITGRISGTPVNTGACTMTVQVTDSTPGAPQSRTVTKTITVE